MYSAYIPLLAGLFLSLFVLYTPIPNTRDETVFNTRLAAETIAAISRDPHSVYDPEAHEEVRIYLRDKLAAFLGAENVYELDYDRGLIDSGRAVEYDIHNLLGVIPGESDTAIMLVGHYDSRGHIGRSGELGESYGAADDGYALAVLLEIARLYAGRDLKNSIYLLITDAEETGLYGANMMATCEDDRMAGVGFVINLEARGVQGPAYMFETSTGNDKIIDFYTNAELPVSYSLATAVYTVMPNKTDFTEFLEVGKRGINFAVLDGLAYYHTPRDSYASINQSSIEHYGRQIVPLVEEFVTNEKYSDVDYFAGTGNQVFFTLFANVFIHYHENVARALHIVFLAAAIAFAVFLFVKKELNAGKLLFGFGAFLGAMLVALIAGGVVGRIAAFVSGTPFSMTYVRSPFGGLATLLTLVGLAAGLYSLYRRKANDSMPEILLVGTIVNLLLALATGLALSGASFLFLVAGLSGLVVLLFDRFVVNKLARRIAYGVLVVINLLVIVPLLFSLYLALTVGGLLALGPILVFYLVVLIPTFDLQRRLESSELIHPACSG